MNDSEVILNEGTSLHWMREYGNSQSRLIYRGSLADLSEMR